MMRNRVAFVVVSLTAIQCSGDFSSQVEEHPAARAEALTAGSVGNGPHAMVICRFNSDPLASDPRDCDPGPPALNPGRVFPINGAADLTSALAQPDLSFPFAKFAYVHDWALGREINFWSYSSTAPARERGMFYANTGNMDVDTHTLLPRAGVTKPTGAPPQNYAMVFTGYLDLPAAATDVVKTIAVGSDHAAYFAIQTCTQDPGPPAACKPGTQVVAISDIGAAPGLTYAVRTIAFPKTGGPFPFQLAAAQTGPDHGVELAWADGTKAAPRFVGGAWPSAASSGFQLIPAASIYSADISASLRASMAGASTVVGDGATVHLTATIVNRGAADAYPANGTDGGLLFNLALPTDELAGGAAAITAVQLNGAALDPKRFKTATITSDSVTYLVVTVPFQSVSVTTPPTNTFNAGDTATIGMDVTLANPLPSTVTDFKAHGQVTGHGTNPAVFGPPDVPAGVAAVAPAVTIAVQTNDPSLRGIADRANAPSGLGGRDDESGANTGNSVTLISADFGADDDDPTLVPVGQAPAASPRISAPAGNVSSVVATTIAGSSSPVRAQNAIRVDLVNADGPGITQAQCTGFAGSWAWDAAASRCACATSSDALGGWSCSPVALPDCAVPSARCFTATASVADLTGSAQLAPVSSAFGVRAPLATVVSRTVNSHVVLVSGTAADGVAGNAANGVQVHVVLAGPNGFSAACDPLAAPAGVPQWSCPIALSGAPSCATAPCILDGAYTATASVREANGSLAGAAIGSYRVDTRPTAFAAPALSNNPRPPFTGHKVGDGPEIRVCAAGAPCTAASALCRKLAAPPNWTCVPAADLGEGAQDAVAFEVDALGALSAPSAPVTSILDLTAPGRPLVSAPADGTFTKETSPALQIAAAEAGGSITVSVLNQAGAVVASCSPEPVPAGKAVTCVPTTALADGAYTLRAVQTDTAGNASPAGTSTLHVKTHTAAPLFAAPLDGGTVPNPVRIEGTAEAGAALAVKIDDGAPVQATADVSGHFSVATGVISTGSHFVQATATDFLGNTAQSDRVKFSVSLGGNVVGSSFGCSSAGGSGTFGALLLLGLVPLLARRRKGAALAVRAASLPLATSTVLAHRRQEAALAERPAASPSATSIALARRGKGAALAVAFVAAAGAARADGTDLALDNFRPASGGDGLIGVEGARPPNDGETPLELRGLLVGQSRPLVFNPDGGGPAQALIRNRVGGWLTAQGHVSGPFSLALQLPFLVQQRGDLSGLPSNVTGGAALAGGLGDLRATVRAGLLRQERALFDLALQASAELPTAKEQSFLGDAAVHGEALVAAGYRVAFSARSALDLLGNAFFRLRPSRDVLGVKAGNEVGLRAGLAWLPGGGMLAPQRVILEAEGASFLRSAFAEGSVPAEWRGGVSYCVGPMAFDFGVGGGLAAGVGTPGLRVIGGVGYEPSVCGASSSRAPSRPPVPIRLVDATRSAPQPETKPDVSSASTAAAAPPTDDKPVPGTSLLAGLLPLPRQKPGPSEEGMLPLPTLPPLPAAKPKKKRVVAQAEPMPDLSSLSALPLPAPAPFATLSGDRVELLRPVVFRGSRISGKEPVLEEVARLLSRHPEIELVAISAPDIGRARAVIAYLRKRGVAPSRLRPEGESAAVELRILRQR